MLRINIFYSFTQKLFTGYYIVYEEFEIFIFVNSVELDKVTRSYCTW